MKVLEFIKKFNHDESGQDLVEYALVLVAVGGAVFTASGSLSTSLGNAITNLDTKIGSWTS
jgi:Flp pilus assembly pilin Flp